MILKIMVVRKVYVENGNFIVLLEDDFWSKDVSKLNKKILL